MAGAKGTWLKIREPACVPAAALVAHSRAPAFGTLSAGAWKLVPARALAVGAAPAGGKNGGGRKEAGDSGANERFERLLSAIAGTPQALARVL
jgi:hypothetical protein